MDPTQILDDIQNKKWLALAVVLVGYVSTLFSQASTFPVSIPDRWKPVVVIVLGQLYAVLEAMAGGEYWLQATEHGLAVSFVTLGIGSLLLEAIFPNGLPKWLQWIPMLALVPKGKRDMSLHPPPMPPEEANGEDKH